MVLKTLCHISYKAFLRKFLGDLACLLCYRIVLYSINTETTDGTSLDVYLKILFLWKLPYILYIEKVSHQCGFSYVFSQNIFCHFWNHTSHTHMVFLQCVFLNAVLVYWRKKKHNCKTRTSVLSLLLYSLSSLKQICQINKKQTGSYSLISPFIKPIHQRNGFIRNRNVLTIQRVEILKL